MFWKPVMTLLLVTFLCGCGTVSTFSLQNLERSPEGRAVQFFNHSQGGRVEGYMVRPKGEGSFPLMVLPHGHHWSGEGAKLLLPVAEQLSGNLCYASLAISLPGYGTTEFESETDKDTATTVILDGISSARNISWIDANRLMLYGFSRGAVFGAAAVTQIAEL